MFVVVALAVVVPLALLVVCMLVIEVRFLLRVRRERRRAERAYDDELRRILDDQRRREWEARAALTRQRFEQHGRVHRRGE